MSERIYVDNYLRGFQLDDFDGQVDAVIAKLATIRDFWVERGYRNLRIDTEQNYDDVEISLYGQALETDEQYRYRMKREEKASELARLKEERERQEYERLRAKFEGK
jgi:pyruvate-formate lyase